MIKTLLMTVVLLAYASLCFGEPRAFFVSVHNRTDKNNKYEMTHDYEYTDGEQWGDSCPSMPPSGVVYWDIEADRDIDIQKNIYDDTYDYLAGKWTKIHVNGPDGQTITSCATYYDNATNSTIAVPCTFQVPRSEKTTVTEIIAEYPPNTINFFVGKTTITSTDPAPILSRDLCNLSAPGYTTRASEYESHADVKLDCNDSEQYQLKVSSERSININTTVKINGVAPRINPDNTASWLLPGNVTCGQTVRLTPTPISGEYGSAASLFVSPIICNTSISEFKASTVKINPSKTETNLFSPEKGTVDFIGEINSTVPVTWKVEVGGKTFSGSGNTVSATWDGTDASGNVVPVGDYTATLTVETSQGCLSTSSVVVTVEYCNVTVSSFNATPPTVNPYTGETTNFSADIYDDSGLPLSWQLNIGGKNYSGTGGVSASWDGKNLQGTPLPPGTYVAELIVSRNDNTCSAKEYIPVEIVKPTDNDCNERDWNSRVNVAGGILSDTIELFSIKQLGTPLQVTLEYQSFSSTNGPMGTGWRHNFEVTAKEWPNGNVSVADGKYRRVYTKIENGYQAPIGETAQLVKNSDGSFILTAKDGASKSFEPGGKIISDLDRNGVGLSFSYNRDSLAKVIDAYNREVIFTYDIVNGKLLSITDPAGNPFIFSYMGGTLSHIAMPEGAEWGFTYTTQGQMASKTDPNGNLTTYEYDNSGRIVSTTDPAGKTRSLTLPAEPSIVEMTSFIEKDGGIWHYIYNNADGRMQSITDPRGKITAYTYDERRNLLSETAQDGTITRYTYDDMSNRTSMTDPLNQTTNYTYNSRGQVLTLTDPMGKTTSYTYDNFGNVLTITDATGAINSFTYDSFGRVLTTTDPLNRTTSFSYDYTPGTGLTVTVTDPSGGSVVSLYAELTSNLVMRTENPAGISTTYEYDKRNRLIRIIDATGTTKYLYAYDKNGNKISEDVFPVNNDNYGKPKRFEYNFKGQLTKTIESVYQQGLGYVDKETIYEYSSIGCASCSGGVDKLTRFTDAIGNITTYEYDPVGNLIKETDPKGNITSYTYDDRGNRIGRTDAIGNLTTYYYDANRNLTGISYSDADNTSVSYTYDALGRMLTASNQNISYTYIYDAAGRVLSVNDSLNRLVSYTYDAAGNRTKMTAPDGKITTYTYTSLNMPSTIKAPSGTFTFTYDASGRLTKITNPNSSSNNFTYDTLGRVNKVTGTTSKGVLITSTMDNRGFNGVEGNYYYDGIIGRQLMVPSSMWWYYEYLSKFGGGIKRTSNSLFSREENFTYDYIGNRLTGPTNATSYTYGPANELLTSGTATYQYDRNGNIVSKVDGTTSFNYHYDFENRLIGVVKQVGNITTSSSFQYDPMGRRIVKSTLSGSTTITSKYLYDGDNILYEHNGNNTVTTRYVNNLGIDDPLGLERGGKGYVYHKNSSGTILAITDSRANTVQAYDYNTYGGIYSQTSSTFIQPYLFTGREWDSETELYYYRARSYDPSIGRFIQRDPIGFFDGPNRYVYVQNNPINYIDPWGLARTTPDAAIQQALARGDIAELETLLDAAATNEGKAAARAALDRLNTRATDMISKECKSSVRKEFPGEMLEKTLEEIIRLANSGFRAAKTAKKLLMDLRFKK